MFVFRHGLRSVSVKPVDATDVVDSDGAKELDGDGVGMNSEFMACAYIQAWKKVSA